ncbi:MAG TPA: DUF4214 domain-containing protein [Pirellulales bacterium]|nr:DUF4214 domain-containing protein [Pirellulales bacterium]
MFAHWTAKQARAQNHRRSKSRRRKGQRHAGRKSLFQLLEQRSLLSAVLWVGGSGNWDDGTHWSGGQVPGSGDNVTIDTGATAATITIKSGDDIQVGSLNTTANDTLAITGGSLVTAGTSTLSGPLDMTGGSLEADANLTANGSTTVSQANLDAENGATLSLPKLTSTITNGSFTANGTGSVLDVSALTKVTQQAGWNVNATAGGEVKLSGLTSLTSTQGININDSGNSTLLDGKLTSLNGVGVTLDGTDPHVADAWTKFTSGTLTVYGNSVGTGYSLSALTDVDQSNLDAESGGQLALPKVTSYVSNQTFFQASGTNPGTSAPSLLDVSALTGLTQQSYWDVHAYFGGEVRLTGLTSLTKTQGIFFTDTYGSTLDLSGLTSLAGTAGGDITESGGSTLVDPKLTTLNGVNVQLDGTDAQVADSWTTLTNGSLEVDTGSYSLPALTDVDQSSLDAESGGQLALPNLTGYVSNENNFQAKGTNTATLQPSLLDVSALTTLTAQQGSWAINALNGGEVKLSGMASLMNGPNQGISLTDTGGSTLVDPKLTTLSGVSVTLDGTDAHVADAWTKLTSGSLEVDGNPSNFGYSLSSLTDVDQSSLFAESGGQLALPKLTSYVSNGFLQNGTFEANGMNTATLQPSVLDVSALTTLTAQPGSWTINALNGGEVELSGLTSLSTSTQDINITDTGGSTVLDGKLTSLDGVNVTTDGSDTQLVNSWTTFTSTSGHPDRLTVTGGSLTFPKLTDLASSSPLGGTALDFPVLAKGSLILGDGTSATIQGTLVALPASGATGATVNAPASQGLSITLDSSGTFNGGTTVNVGAGTTLALAGGTYLGGVNFNFGAAATADLTGGQTTTYGGTLAATGAGTVVISGGIFYPATGGGATLNFPGGMFQWTGGGMELSVGDVTNRGTINLSGSNDTQIFADGTLDNYGSIIQTGSGDFNLHSDSITPTTLKIEPSGQYQMESDAGINNFYGTNLIDNAGTIAKKAGTGTSTIGVNGQIINTGTIEADSGTLDLEPSSFAQIDANGNLTGGTWKALNGAALNFPSGTSITTNAATIALDGSGAAVTAVYPGGTGYSALSALASNSGTLALTNGASLNTAGDFANSGSLTLGGALAVGGNFTQTSAGTLDVQIGGSPTSGNFGQVAVTGSATLAGNFNVSLVNSFTPVAGQDYPVLKYTSATGSFATVTGLPSRMTVNQTATELDVDMPSAGADPGLTSVTAPTTASDGQSITVDWQVKDENGAAANGNWLDSVYLSTMPTITAGSIMLGRVEHTGGLAANGSYDGSLNAAVPALAPGNYYVLVEADSHDQVPDPDRSNNTLAATTGQLAVSVPALTLGKSTSGSFTAADQDQYYQVTAPAGGALVVTLTSAASSGATAVYVSQGIEPTPYGYQLAAVADQPNQTLNVPNAVGGTYYILVHSVSGNAATAGYTLTASQTAALSISSISSYAGGVFGSVTIEIDGANFTPSTTASLTLIPSPVSLGPATIQASAVDFVSPSQLFATFLLGDTGSYTLSVQQGAQSAKAPTPFQAVVPTTFALGATLVTPQFVRSGRTGSIVITYTNDSANDLMATLLDISSTNPKVLFSTPDDPNNFVTQAQVLAVAPNGPAGILRPGQSGQLTLQLLSDDTIDGDEMPVTVSEVAPAPPPHVFGGATISEASTAAQIDESQTIDWASQESALRPASIPAAAWSVIYGNLTSALGTTVESYNAALAQAATYLGNLGDTTAQVSDVSRLWSFLVAQANASFPTPTLASAVDASLPTPGGLSLAIGRTFNSSIGGRSTPGIFGLGWSTSWQSSLSVDAAGNVTIDSGGAVSFFVAQPNGDYLDTAGESGTLTSSGGVFTFTSISGTQDVFLASGLLNYVQDTNGNRITLGYNSGKQLVTLTYSNPADASEPNETLTLSYNSQGLVSQVADGTGAKWSYVYDTSAHLLSVTAPGNLTTSYAYDTGTNAETANALLSITNPDGSQDNFTYDPATGRLTGTSANGGADAIAYAFLGQGEVSATDSAGNQSIVWFDDQGAAARVQGPNGGVSNSLFDDNGNLVRYTNAAAASYQYAYSQNGDLTQITDPLGQTQTRTYGPLGTLTSYSDASGSTTQISSDSTTGNVMSITYADGTSRQFSYDPLGDLKETVLQNGDAIGYEHNNQGLVSQITFADKTYQVFVYDARGNLTKAETYDATGTLTGTTTLVYDTNNPDELVSISYPNGLSLSFTYNPTTGQRIQSKDNNGFIVNYQYDAQGRLSKLTDGTGKLIVQYTYNDLGQLSAKKNGNVTSTVYGYDPAGNLTSIVNYAPDGKTVNSSFTYSYNLLGEVTKMVSAAGTTTYGYDATGQLTQVGLPDGTSISYAFNAAGDRTQVTTNGTATNYKSNAANEITQVGSATYFYDKNGNLHTVSDSSGTTTYNYNDLNQLVSIAAPDGTVTNFQYSPLGFMMGSSTTPAGGSASQTNYLVDPTGLGNVVGAYTGSGSVIADYTYGLGLVSQTGLSGTGYYDFDLTGNTVGITGASGSYVNQYSYRPFGETTTVGTPQLPNAFTFAGQSGVMQIGDNLFDMRARDYTPATGQFLSNDPTGLAGGDTNLRRYVANDPVDGNDPSGLVPVRFAAPSLADALAGASAAEMAGAYSAAVYQAAYASAIAQGGWWAANAQSYATAQAQDALLFAQGPTANASYIRQFILAHSQPAASAGGAGLEVPISRDTKVAFASPVGVAGAGLVVPILPGTKVAFAIPVVVISTDPNALIGPGGFGPQNFIQPNGTWSYTVDFENDGSVAAQDVTVSEQLDANLDWSTFQLGSVGFGAVNVNVPAGLTQYQTTVAYQNVDGSSLNVQVALDFNVQTGKLTATFTSLDPLTGQPPTGVTDGFLPPDDKNHIGEGYVQYSVRPKANLATGAVVNEAATVVFDTNAPINTNTASNTIDADPPTSSVAALPGTETATSFTVSWSGTDDSGGSGIASYNVFVSDNGGPFTAFQTDTTKTSATFTGVNGHTYAFYSVSTDNVGNVQTTPTAAQTTTKVSVGAVLPTSSVAALPATETSTSFTVSWSGSDTGGPGIAGYDVYVADNGGAFTAFKTDTTATSATFTGVSGHTYGFYSVAIDTAGNRQTTPTAAQATTKVSVGAVLPTSSVAALPATETSTSFTVSWSGSDVGGPGIAAYDIYVADDAQELTAFKTDTTATSFTFTGVNGHTYGFASVAIDTAGNRQPTPFLPQATTFVSVGAVLPTSSVAALPATETSTSFTVSWSGSDVGGPGIAGYDVFVADNGGAFTAFKTDTTATSATFSGVNGHTYGFYSVAIDSAGNRQTTPTAAQATTTVSTATFSVTDHTYTIGSGTVTVSAANGLLTGDTGPSQLTVTAGTVTGAQGGTFAFHADGSFTYTPGASFPGYDNAQVTVTDTSGDKGTATVNVLSQHAGVVWKFYESALNRVPDAAGLQYWTNYFNSGGNTGDMAFGFFESDELLDKVLGNYYEQYLLRPLDSGGLAYWKGIWHATGGPEQIKAGFADSPEFFNSAGATPDAWIDALYQRILNRTPDPNGKTFWLNYYQQQTAAGVDAGTVRYNIALGFFDSPEAYGNDVTGWFQEYLFRAPTDAEKSQYANQMEAGATDRTIEQAITNLPEYANNPAQPGAGTATTLPDYYQTSPASSQSEAVVAAKDALFSRL